MDASFYSLNLNKFVKFVFVVYFIGHTDNYSVAAGNQSVSISSLYESGVQAYLENNFEECVQVLSRAIEEYQQITKSKHGCRLRCHEEVAFANPLYPINVEDLYFFEKTIKNTLCLMKCFKNDMRSMGHVEMEIVRLFENREPYKYLHSCYYQIKDLQKAASSAFTYLVTNPNDMIVTKSLKFYASQPEVILEDILNYESKDYVYLYVKGTQAYTDKIWSEVIDNMEESLLSFIESEDECRVSCEGTFNAGWIPDFVPSIANHFAYVLRCKRKCKESLSTLNGEKHDDLLPSHYHYLQFAYFKVGNLEQACRCAASYLLFFPFDETMLDNVKFYKKMPKFKEEFLKPRTDALRYIQRDQYEENLTEYILENFHSNSEDGNNQVSHDSSVNFIKSD